MIDEGQHSLIAFGLFFTWILGWLFIPSGIYFWRTGKSVFASPKSPYRTRVTFDTYFPRLKRKDFDTTVEEGPQVRWTGIKQLIAGIILMLLFIPLFVSFWQNTPNLETRIIAVLALAGLLPLLWYFGTPGEHSKEGKGGGEEENMTNSSEGLEE